MADKKVHICKDCEQPVESAGHQCPTAKDEQDEGTPGARPRHDYRGAPWWLDGKLQTKSGDEQAPK